MTEENSVLVDREGPVTIISINRPHCRNAVDGATARKLYDAFVAFDADKDASVAVFTGAGRPVGAHEAHRMGLANRLVARGEACAHAIALAREIARFPQNCMRADRLSALRQWDLSEEDAIANEMRGGLEVIASGETLSGAARFASGTGRHGTFGREVND